MIDREKWYSSQVQDGEVDQQTTSFIDLAQPEVIMTQHTQEELADNTAMTAVSLSDFLARPVMIRSITWSENDLSGMKDSFSPWNLFFNDTRIKYKLNNWAFIKCDLKLRILFNASPFYYGAAMFNYQPLPNYSRSAIYNDTTLNQMIPYSQMPLRAMVYPQSPENVEITLPFFSPVNFLHCQKAQDFIDMGTVFMNILDGLQSANEVSGIGINFQVYAWAENVVLSGPSVGLAMQDGVVDEYQDEGPVSRPASAIANIAARLGDVPIIGRFATATQIGATAVAGIAKLFGFTNVPVVHDQHGVAVRSFPPIASTEIGYPVEKLTLDSKNELTIDHRSVGLGPLDELPICHIAQRESYLSKVNWSTSSNVDALLLSCPVTPQLYSCASDTNQYLYMTPMCWLSTMFNYWRGDIIVRFRVVCSKYHRGRLRISYDPDGYSSENIVSDSISSSVVMTKIIDIAEETDVEFRIPYQQFSAWLTCKSVSTFNQTNAPVGNTFKHERSYTNGCFTIRVHNVLTAPVATSTVSVLLFVRGAENLDFSSPTSVGIERLTTAFIQDGDVENKGESGTLATIAGIPSRPIDHLYLTYMGERVGSLRVLLRRMCRIMTHVPAAETIQDLVIKSLTLGRIPPYLGWHDDALNTAKGIIDTTTTYKFNWTSGNFLTYITPAFVGNRGSVNWSANLDMGYVGNLLKHFTVVRDKSSQKIKQSAIGANLGSTSANTKFMFEQFYTTGSGGLVVNQTASSAHWAVPWLSPAKFAPTDLAWQNYNDGTRLPISTNDMWSAQWSLSGSYGAQPTGAKLHLYAGAGTDFDLLYFLHVPVYGVLSSYPTAV